jgi:hypothetical protein
MHGFVRLWKRNAGLGTHFPVQLVQLQQSRGGVTAKTTDRSPLVVSGKHGYFQRPPEGETHIGLVLFERNWSKDTFVL